MDRLRKYIVFLVCLIPAITYVECDGQIAIVEKPSSMILKPGEEMLSSEVLELMEHCLGFQTEGAGQMRLTNVFEHNGIKLMLIHVKNSQFDALSSNAIKTYQLKEDVSFDDIVNEVNKEMSERKNIFGMNVRMNKFENLKSIDVNDRNPQMVWAKLESVEKPEVMKTMAELTKAVEGSPNILKIVMTSDGKLSGTYDRQKRQTPPATNEPSGDNKQLVTAESLNLADDYDENFPIIFNIMLWFSLALIFTLISICMVIANMDPGRDSIIYRMTSTRMKKDN